MRIEKRATNKVGLVLLFLIVIAALAGGGYYLYTHKDSLKTDWNISVPWTKSEEKKEEEKRAKAKGSTGYTGFTKPDGYAMDNLEINTDSASAKCGFRLIDGIEIKDNNVVLTYEMYKKPRETGEPVSSCSVKGTRFLVDGFDISSEMYTELGVGESSKKGEIRFKLSELESQELVGMKDLSIYVVWTEKEEVLANMKNINIPFKNIKYPKNDFTGITVDELIGLDNTVKITYYDTREDNDNTYIYFLYESKTKGNTFKSDNDLIITFKIKKLVLNDKVYDATKYEKIIRGGGKNIGYIAIPKEDVSKVTKFRISFMVLTELSSEAAAKVKTGEPTAAYFVSKEYAREIK